LLRTRVLTEPRPQSLASVPGQTPQQAQNGQGVPVYTTQSSRGTWLFQANPNQGANS